MRGDGPPFIGGEEGMSMEYSPHKATKPMFRCIEPRPIISTDVGHDISVNQPKLGPNRLGGGATAPMVWVHPC
jgi:hypothetical protein